MFNPFNPFRDVTRDVTSEAQKLIERNEQGWQGIEDMTDEELDGLYQQAKSLYEDAGGDKRANEIVRDALFYTREAVLAERWRRTQAKTSEQVRRANFKTSVIGVLARLAGAASDLASAAKSQGADMDYLLGKAVIPNRITADDAQIMTDGELEDERERQRELTQSAPELAGCIDAIEAAAKDALTIVAEIRKRAPRFESVRNRAATNVETLNRERDARRLERESKAEEMAMTDEELRSMVSDISRQLEELMQR